MRSIGRRELLLLLIGLGEKPGDLGSVSGVTRIQKFLFLLEREFGVVPHEDGFDFIPYKAGPYSPKLYDDLELLENLGLVQSQAIGEAALSEVDIGSLTFGDLVGGDEEMAEGPCTTDRFEERRYRLTEKGKAKVDELLKEPTLQASCEGIRAIKSKFNCYSLNDILCYVYDRYPDMTVESEIKDRVLGRKRRR